VNRKEGAQERMRAAFEANATDILAYLERRIEPRSAAADVLGDAMVTAWRRVDNLPFEPEQARMWLFVVARNTLLNQRRALGRHRAAVDRLREIIVSDMAASTSDIDHAESRAALQAAMRSLDPADAELVRLVNWDGFTLAEVAKLENLAASTLRSRYARALRQLAAILNPATKEDPAATGSQNG
jgi:RNA polymerase sigma-70 factor (ECF subfamily)